MTEAANHLFPDVLPSMTEAVKQILDSNGAGAVNGLIRFCGKVFSTCHDCGR